MPQDESSCVEEPAVPALDLRTWADKKRLSVTRLEALQECGRKAYYKYELPPHLRPPDPPGNALLEGTALHAGVEFLRTLQLHGEDWESPGAWVKAHRHLDAAYDEALVQAGGVPSVVWGKHISPDQSRQLVHGGLEAYCRLPPKEGGPPLLRRYTPQAVEHPFDLRIPGSSWTIEGRIDLLVSGTVFDLKFKGKAMYQNEVDQKIQLTAYPYALLHTTGELIRRAGIHNVIKPSLPRGCKDLRTLPNYPPREYTAYRVQEVTTYRDQDDFAEFEEYLHEVIQQVESGVFTRRLESTFCFWCAYLPVCRPHWARRTGRVASGGDDE